VRTAQWEVAGSYFEACNCDVICPCRSVGGRPGGRSTHGVCQFVLSWQVTLLALLLLRKWPAGAAYVLASLAFVLTSGSLLSVTRYLLTAFPVFFAIGGAFERWRALDVVYSLAGIASLVYLTAQFVAFGWVA